jgi:hypothetical protein
MNKLTITEKVFVPVETRGNLLDFFMIRYKKDLIGIKEETNKYLLSREELEKVISDAYAEGTENPLMVGSYPAFDVTKQSNENKIKYINSIL